MSCMERMPVPIHPTASPHRITVVREGMRSRLTTDADALGLRRVDVSTTIGDISAHVGVREGPVATVLLHGAAGSWTTWTPLLTEAARTGAPVPDVVAVDLPGWGDSTFPRGGIDIARTTAAVRAVVVSLGYRRWILVGHSLGGAVALDMAARAPEAAGAVILVSPSGAAVFDAVRRPIRGGLRLPWFAGMLCAMRFLRSLGRAAPALLRLLQRSGILRALSAPLFADPRTIDRSVTRALAEEIRPASFVAAARAAAAYDESAWRGIRCPVRAVCGDRDVFVGAQDTVALSARIDDFREVTLDSVGHFAAVERPGAVLALLRDALAHEPPRREHERGRDSLAR